MQRGTLTHAEIVQQPELWPTTLDRVADRSALISADAHVVLTGAGTSAYAAAAIAAAWPGGRAIPTTSLLVDSSDFAPDALLISLARSGNSPESTAVIRKIRRSHPGVAHLVITCNPEGQLANFTGIEAILLDSRTNDRSLAMTSSFSNLVLAGIALRHAEALRPVLPGICGRVQSMLPELEQSAHDIAQACPARVAVLASPPLEAAARETALKILEMTGGRTVALSETFLGLRHGPMSFLNRDSLVVCLLSSDPLRRPYELDVMNELREKRLGTVVAIGESTGEPIVCDLLIPAMAPTLADPLRTSFEIVFPQLLAFHLSLAIGLDPDNPSPEGVINRVVRGVHIHES